MGILRNLGDFARLDLPLMVGVSRKRFPGDLLPLGAPAAERDLPTAVLSAFLSGQGVNALRVHDVSSTRIALEAFSRLP